MGLSRSALPPEIHSLRDTLWDYGQLTQEVKGVCEFRSIIIVHGEVRDKVLERHVEGVDLSVRQGRVLLSEPS